MLSKILPAKECAKCRNCCVFHEKSRWETPVVSKKKAEKIKRFLQTEDCVVPDNDKNSYSLSTVERDVKLSKDAEKYRCVALDEKSGCMLGKDEKPFDCSIWPLRVMKNEDRLYIMLAEDCHFLDGTFVEKINKILLEGLKEHILSEIKENPYIIKPYNDNYMEICDITEEVKKMQ